jgi:2-octaprenyl-6-methoxyphenol hydroxylase
MERAEYDVLIAGTGPVGLIAALAFADAGFRTALVGPKASTNDGRTTAIMDPALRYLDALMMGPFLHEHGEPLKTMRIVDATARLVRSPTVTFRAAEIDLPAFGLNIANAELNAALESAAVARPGVVRHEALVERWEPGEGRVAAKLSDGSELAARLVVAADGRSSPARLAAGIEVDARPTGQTAIVLAFSHTRPHSGISTEFHTESGPFTQVPLAGDRSSLVWVVKSDDAAELLALGRAELAQRVERQMRSMLGRVTVDTDPQAYPLSTSQPRRYADKRIALIGEAAHVFPPIGAQGLNLGIRDVESLVSVATRHRADPGASAALAEYEVRRRPDVAMRAGAVNLLNRSLLSDFLPAQLARSTVFEALRAFSPIRAFFMHEGMRPGSGLRALLPLRTRDRRATDRT